jgi:hypothetical protein
MTAATAKVKTALIREQKRAYNLRGLMFLFLPQSPAAY